MQYRTVLSDIVPYVGATVVGIVVYKSLTVLCYGFFYEIAWSEEVILVGGSIMLSIYCVDPFRYYIRKVFKTNQEGKTTVEYTSTLCTFAHSIKTQITIIRLYLERGDGNERNIIEESLDRIHTITNTFIRIESADTESFERIDFCDLVQGQIEYIQALFEQEGIQLIVYVAPLLCVYGNAQQLQDAILALLHNAYKYRCRDGTQSVVTIVLRSTHDTVQLSISDTGIGIESQDISYIFDLFYRSPQVKNVYEGDGLGLAFVKKVVGLHRGTISVTSTLHKGTSFVLSFPRIN